MSKIKTWEITGLSCKEDLGSSAKIILQNRLENLLNSITLYFNQIDEINLHKLRIALRRVRYPMEVFIKCFNRKKYLSFYKLISSLQDSSGSVRDLDVLKQNEERFRKQNKSNFEGILISKIDVKKNQLQSSFKLELMKFVHSKELKEFKKIINRHI